MFSSFSKKTKTEKCHDVEWGNAFKFSRVRVINHELVDMDVVLRT